MWAAALGWALLVILGLAVLILALPVHLRASARSSPSGRYWLQVSVLAGLVPYVTVLDSARPKRAPKAKETEKAAKPKGDARRSDTGRRMIRHAPQLLFGLLRQFRFRSLELCGHFGLSDPAATGELYGMLCPALYGIPPGARVRIDVTPAFDRPCLEGHAHADVSVVPAGLLPPVARFAWRSFVAKEA